MVNSNSLAISSTVNLLLAKRLEGWKGRKKVGRLEHWSSCIFPTILAFFDRAERRRREARRDKCTRDKCTLPTIPLKGTMRPNMVPNSN